MFSFEDVEPDYVVALPYLMLINCGIECATFEMSDWISMPSDWVSFFTVAGPSVCSAWGDPHYTTLDKFKYDFQGDCEYTLVRDCWPSPDLPSFHVIAKNIKRDPTHRVSFTRDLTFEFRGTVYSLLTGGEVQIDGVTATLPVRRSDGVSISSSGLAVVRDLSLF